MLHLMYPSKDLGGANAFGCALIACVHQPEDATLLSTFGRHDGGLSPAVHKSCQPVAIHLFDDQSLTDSLMQDCSLSVL